MYVSPGYWNDTRNQCAFMDNLAKALHLRDTQEWNNVTAHTVQQRGGAGLLRKYNNSLVTLLRAVYPKYLRTTM